MRKLWSLCIILLLTGSLSAGCSVPSFGLLPPATYPSLTPAEGSFAVEEFRTSFAFQSSVVTIAVPVDPAVYRGARDADKNAFLYETIEKSEWLPEYYRAFIIDEDLFGLYDALLVALRDAARTQGLDDDEYLDLVAVFVQSLPYRTGPDDVPPKFPVETIVENGGDCDDKSLLLAALLSREGYNVSLLYFGDENHMAVGVRSGDCGYRSTGYAFIETTNVTFVGVPTTELEGGLELASDPVVFPVGSGERGYGSCAETTYISSASERITERLGELRPIVDEQNRLLAEQLVVIDGMEAQLDLLSASGNIAAYNRKVTDYNRLVAEYNADLAACSELRDTYNELAGIHNYIVTHQHDREGTYRWVAAQELLR
jgi:hypothetical protein